MTLNLQLNGAKRTIRKHFATLVESLQVLVMEDQQTLASSYESY